MDVTEKRDISNCDFSGMEQFWKIISILEKDEEPDTEEWEALLNTPGYKVLLAEELPKEFFIKYFTLAFMPSRVEDLKMELKKGGIISEFLKHYVRVKSMKKEIKAYQEKLKSCVSIIDSALNLAQEYLPKGVIERYPLPSVSFVIFGYDARGYSPIVVDLLFSMDLRDSLSYLLAHEFHHFYRNKELKFRFPREVSGERYILWTLNQIQAEGIADQIDKPYLLFNEGGIFNKMQFGEKYKKYLNKSPEIIGRMDEILKELKFSSGKTNELGQEFFKAVPMSGHPTGYFMTNLIIKKLGKAILIKELGNPFAFFRLYNKAARMDGDYPTFSEGSMTFLSYLEEIYRKQ